MVWDRSDGAVDGGKRPGMGSVLKGDPVLADGLAGGVVEQWDGEECFY